MMLRSRAAAVLLALSGCASGSGPGPAAAPPLAYRVPTPAAIRYTVGDSVRVQISAAGQSFALTAEARESWAMAFAPAREGVQVTAALTDLDARITNPMGPAQTADESIVKGAVVFTLDPRGRAAVERLPEVGQAAAQFLTGARMAHAFFPRLPGRPVGAGDRWVDTVAYTSSEGGAETTVRTVTAYAVAGDTTLNGLSGLLLVRSTGTTEQSSTGSMGGTTFQQSVTGGTSGHFVWDREAHRLVSLWSDSDLTGSMEVSIAPIPLAVRVLAKVRVQAEPEGTP